MNSNEPKCNLEDSIFRIEPMKATISGRTTFELIIYFQSQIEKAHEAIIMAYPKIKFKEI